MALGTCGECSKELSTSALRCPHCGGFTRRAKKFGKILVAAVAVLLVATVVMNKMAADDARELELFRNKLENERAKEKALDDLNRQIERIGK